MPDVELLPAQAQLMRSTSRYVMFVGGVGSGKTAGVVRKAVDIGLRNAPLHGLFTEPTDALLNDVAIPSFVEYLDEIGLRYEVYRSPGNKRIEVFSSPPFSILLKSTENARMKIGINAAWAIIDEFGQVSEEAFDGIDKRVRHPNSKQRQTICAGTPELRVQWPEKLFIDEPMTDSVVIRARTLDNTYLPEDYEAKLRERLAPDEVKRYLEGEFVPPRGQVYCFFGDDSVQECKKPLAGDIVIGADFNVDKMSWVILRRSGNRMHVWREHVRDNTNVMEHALEVATILRDEFAKEGQRFSVEEAAAMATVIPDSSGHARSAASSLSLVEHIRRQGFRIAGRASNPAIVDRVESVNYRLKTRELLIDPSCKNLITSLRKQGYAKDGMPDKKQGFDHGPDALGYAVYYFARSWKEEARR